MNMKLFGHRRAMKKLDRLQHEFPLIARDASRETLEQVIESANNNLRARMKGTTWSHGDNQPSIFDSWRIIDDPTNKDSLLLINESPHAAAVEFGVPGIIRPKGAGKLYLGAGTYRSFVQGQMGYGFFSEATADLNTIRNNYVYNLRKRLGSLI